MSRPLIILLATLSLVACNEASSSPDTSGGDDTDDTDGPVETDCTQYTDYDEQALCQHNYVRAYGADPAPDPDLDSMVWNTQLEDLARSHAEQCIWEHNADRSDGFSEYIGENLFAATYEATAIQAVNSWAEEVDFYDYTENSCDDGEMCGHYTQIVWRDTTDVGCAMAYCSNLENTSWTSSAYLVVCNYSPGGNYIGEQPY